MGRTAVLALAILGIMAQNSRLAAQDAGVSGIPPGPANARGLNGSVNDPSGIGNAAKIPPLPQPNLNPVPVPQVAYPTFTRSYPSYAPGTYPQGLTAVVKTRRTRHGPSRHHRPADEARASARDRMIGDHIPSICRGC